MTKYKEFTPSDIADLRAGLVEWSYFPAQVALDALARIENLNTALEQAKGIADRANKAMEKHLKHNGALEIAVQEAHRDTDAITLQLEEEKKIAGARKRIADNLETQRDELRTKLAHAEAQIGVLKDALAAAPDAYRCMDCFSHLPKGDWDKALEIMGKAEELCVEKPKCGHPGPAGLLCELEKGHPGQNHMGDCSKAYPNQRKEPEKPQCRGCELPEGHSELCCSCERCLQKQRASPLAVGCPNCGATVGHASFCGVHSRGGQP